MTVLGSDGLSLLVGNGAGSEVFSALKGVAITRLEVTQRSHIATAISADAWQVSAGASNRRAVIDGEAYATDDASTLRLRSLALAGGTGNFKLKLSGSETLQFSAVVTLYHERTEAGRIKRVQFTLDSSASASVI
jgi:hypothetical protein